MNCKTVGLNDETMKMPITYAKTASAGSGAGYKRNYKTEHLCRDTNRCAEHAPHLRLAFFVIGKDKFN